MHNGISLKPTKSNITIDNSQAPHNGQNHLGIEGNFSAVGFSRGSMHLDPPANKNMTHMIYFACEADNSSGIDIFKLTNYQNNTNRSPCL